MKSIWFISAMSLFIPITAMGQINYNIEGDFPENSKGKVYLSTSEDPYNKIPSVKLDSTTVNEKGHFVLQGKGKDGEILILSSGYDKTVVVLQSGTTKVSKEIIGTKVEGTSYNDDITSFDKEIGDLLRSRNGLQFKIADDSTLTKVQRDRMIEHIKDSTTQIALNIAAGYIKKNKNNGVAEYALYEALRFTGDNIEPYDRLYSLMDKRPVSYGALKGAISRLESVRATSPGKMFKDFTVNNGNLDGTSVKLSDYVGHGKFVLLDFWASWCIWCRAEFPTLSKVYEKYKGDDFQIVGLVVDDKLEETKKALQKEKMVVWPQIVNAGADERRLYGVFGIPQIILFAPDGTIVARNLRGQVLVDTIEKALTEYRKSKN